MEPDLWTIDAVCDSHRSQVSRFFLILAPHDGLGVATHIFNYPSAQREITADKAVTLELKDGGLVTSLSLKHFFALLLGLGNVLTIDGDSKMIGKSRHGNV